MAAHAHLGEPDQVQLPSADVATTRARVSSRRFGHLDLITTNLRLTFDRGACMENSPKW